MTRIFDLRRTAAFTLAACVAFGAAPCRADEAADRAAAEALYELGQKLFKDGNYAEACPKLEASNSLDPGVGTLLLLGDCLEKAGKLASAWGSFKDAGALARSRNDLERANMADLRATALRPRLAYVEYRVSSEARVAGLEVRRGGALIASGSWGVPLPTDAGTYDVVASAPGHETWRTTLEVPPKLDVPLVVSVPALRASGENGAGTTPNVAPVAAVAPAAPVEPARRESEHADQGTPGSGQRVLGVVSFGVGVASAIASGTLAYMAAKKNHDSKNQCRADDTNVCTVEGVNQRDDAKHLATLATVFGVGGAVFAATGITLYLTAPRGKEQHPTGFVAGFDARF
jgi:serine/threonine-protein kinase